MSLKESALVSQLGESSDMAVYGACILAAILVPHLEFFTKCRKGFTSDCMHVHNGMHIWTRAMNRRVYIVSGRVHAVHVSPNDDASVVHQD